MEAHLIILVILLGTCSITLSLFYYSQTKSILWLTIFGFFACAALFIPVILQVTGFSWN